MTKPSAGRAFRCIERKERTERKWTRSQRIRTAAEVPFQIALLETMQALAYQRIASQAKHLKDLGLSLSGIAHHLGVTDKTVAKGLAWMHGRS